MHVASCECACVAIDTETTSFRGSVIQAALVEISFDGTEMDAFCHVVSPPIGESLNARAVAVHGITADRIAREAVPARAFFEEFARKLRAAREAGKVVVAHNAAFDVARLNETFAAHGLLDRIDVQDVFCTMVATKKHDGKGAKMTKNGLLYSRLHGGRCPYECMGRLHDAAVDARITAINYLAGRRIGWW